MGTIKRKLLLSSGVLMSQLAATQVVLADHPTVSESEVLSIRNQTPYAVWKGGTDITPAEYKGAILRSLSYITNGRKMVKIGMLLVQVLLFHQMLF